MLTVDHNNSELRIPTVRISICQMQKLIDTFFSHEHLASCITSSELLVMGGRCWVDATLISHNCQFMGYNNEQIIRDYPLVRGLMNIWCSGHRGQLQFALNQVMWSDDIVLYIIPRAMAGFPHNSTHQSCINLLVDFGLRYFNGWPYDCILIQEHLQHWVQDHKMILSSSFELCTAMQIICKYVWQNNSTVRH